MQNYRPDYRLVRTHFHFNLLWMASMTPTPDPRLPSVPAPRGAFAIHSLGTHTHSTHSERQPPTSTLFYSVQPSRSTFRRWRHRSHYGARFLGLWPASSDPEPWRALKARHRQPSNRALDRDRRLRHAGTDLEPRYVYWRGYSGIF